MRRFLFTLLGLLLLAGQVLSARAQSGAVADVTLIDTQSFPTVGALLDIFDAQGQFIAGLEPADVTVLEDGNPQPVEGLSESTPPAQIAVAVNPGPALAVRDDEGIERFTRIVELLAGWANARPTENPDDLSLVTIAGPIITHATPSDWAVSLNSFRPDFRATTPNVQLLTIALNTVIERAPLPGTKRALLIITPHMEDANIDLTLNTFAQQAQEAKVRVFVWLVDTDTYFDHPSATAFKALALQTGGSYFAFSGLETLPDPEMYFSPLRHGYALSYSSSIATSGEHSLAVQVQTPGGQIESDSRTFSLDIQPPNPILVMPPGQIIRQAPPDDPFNTEVLVPNQQTLELIIEFTDEHPRPLARTTLYVDGEPVAQNDTEPFDTFIWDLNAYSQSGQHELVVEAVDSLGLSKTSLGFPVDITVIHAPTGMQAILAKYRMQITIGAVILAGFVLIAILLYGRVRIKSRRERREERIRNIDPVTQPLSIRQAEPITDRKGARKGKQAGGRLPWTRAGRLPEAPAYLVRLGTDEEPLSGNPIPLLEKEISFGTDPVQSMHVLDHPSVAPLHTVIKQTDEGDFLILDQGTVAGTWINYEPIPQVGCILKHGDVVHFGLLMYRFKLHKPPAESEPKIIPEVPAE